MNRLRNKGSIFPEVFIMSIAYYNGEFEDFSSIKIPLTDRCVFFGDGIYDAAIGTDGVIYLEAEHLDRFFQNAKKLNMETNLTKKKLSGLLRKVIEKNGYKQYFVYFQLTRSAPTRVHSYPKKAKTNLLITVNPHTFPNCEKPISLITREDIRYSMCDIKTLNLLPAVMASRAAEDAECQEAVFIRNGTVTECAHSNVFIVKEGKIYTHPESRYILPGITRKRVLMLCEKLGISYAEEPFSYDDMIRADEVLITSTTKLCLSANKVDGIAINSGKSDVGKRIISALREDFWLCKNQRNRKLLKF